MPWFELINRLSLLYTLVIIVSIGQVIKRLPFISLRSLRDYHSYHLGHRYGVEELINRVNANIINSLRLPQFISVCKVIRITYIPAIPLTLDNAWYTGMFDADGCFSASFSIVSPRITATVTQKHRENTLDFLIFGGYVVDRSHENHYRWQTNKKSNILDLASYLSSYPSLTHKHHRIVLIGEFYQLLMSNANKPRSVHHPLWLSLNNNWKYWSGH